MILALGLAAAGVLQLVAWNIVAAPARRRHRHDVLWRLWQQSGVVAAYAFAHKHRWPETALLRPEVVRLDPLSGEELNSEYHRLLRGPR